MTPRFNRISFALLALFCVHINAFDMDLTYNFLTKYGYLPKNDSMLKNEINEKVLTEPLSKCQKMAGIPVTGKVDKQVEKIMLTPRCGVMDPGNQSYTLMGNWKKRHLTYKIFQYTEKLSRQDVDREIANAFAVWARYTDLTFSPANGYVDIEIRFTRGSPNARFDGPGGTLAYAYFPENGDVYFDESENWTLDPKKGTSLFYVAVHELGHSLGLKHSSDERAVMYAWYKDPHPLAEDDVRGIQALYGIKRPRRPRPYQPRVYPNHPNNIPNYGNNKPSNPNWKNKFKPKKGNGSCLSLCKDPNLDAALKLNDEAVYVFKGDSYWKIIGEGFCEEPRKINTRWIDLPWPIDAAFFAKNGKTYFFREHFYWAYVNSNMLPGYPKSISSQTSKGGQWNGKTKIFYDDSTVYSYKGGKLSTSKYNKQSTSLQNMKLKNIGYTVIIQDLKGNKHFFENNHFYRSGKISTMKLLGCSGKRKISSQKGASPGKKQPKNKNQKLNKKSKLKKP